MNRDIVRQLSVIATTVFALIINILATSLPLNGVTTAALSDAYLIRFVPAGYVFSVWGIIYMGLLAFTVYQALPSQRENPRLRAIAWWYVVGNLANAFWLIFWHYYQVEITLGFMLLLLGTLLYSVSYLHKNKATSTTESLCVDLGYHIYTGWISVATIVNVTVVLFRNLETTDEMALQWSLILVVVAAIVAVSQRILRNDTAFGMVIAWALYGVGVKQQLYVTNSILPAAPQLVLWSQTAAMILATLLAVWWLVSIIRNSRTPQTV
jgi:benzodiazapine receptor